MLLVVNRYEVAKDIRYFVAHTNSECFVCSRNQSLTFTTTTRYDCAMWCLPEIVIHIIICFQLKFCLTICEVYMECLQYSYGGTIEVYCDFLNTRDYSMMNDAVNARHINWLQCAQIKY